MSVRPHTPEPWWDETGVAHARGPEWTEENHSCVHPISNGNGNRNDCAHACECVTACTGINPVAVPKLLKACDAALAFAVKGCLCNYKGTCAFCKLAAKISRAIDAARA